MRMGKVNKRRGKETRGTTRGRKGRWVIAGEPWEVKVAWTSSE